MFALDGRGRRHGTSGTQSTARGPQTAPRSGYIALKSGGGSGRFDGLHSPTLQGRILQRRSKTLARVRSCTRYQRSFLNIVGTVCPFNRYDERCIFTPVVNGKRQRGSLPDFLVIGAQKAGTTYLYGLLRSHPRVKAAAKKEVHFFDTPKWRKGMGFYGEQFPDTSGGFVTGEATPYYLFEPRVPGRVASTLPSVKLVVLLRNPVERAYSDWRHKVRQGTEDLAFEAALAAEGARTAGERERMLADEHYYSRALRRYSYLSRGVYVDQLARWRERFAGDRLLVAKSEDLYANPERVCEEVLDFLSLNRRALTARGYGYGGEAEPMKPETHRRLEEYYRPHNLKLYEYLGRDFGW